jgi:hypothetical protein
MMILVGRYMIIELAYDDIDATYYISKLTIYRLRSLEMVVEDLFVVVGLVMVNLDLF